MSVDDLLEIQRRVNEIHELTYSYLKYSAIGAEECRACGEFYLRPLIHACKPSAAHRNFGTEGEVMTFERFRELVDDASKRPFGWRYGQAAFNGLRDIRPDLSEQIRGTPLDPFHHDERMAAFYEWLQAYWDS